MEYLIYIYKTLVVSSETVKSISSCPYEITCCFFLYKKKAVKRSKNDCSIIQLC